MAKNIRHVLPTRSAIKVTVAAIKPYTDIISAAPGAYGQTPFSLLIYPFCFSAEGGVALTCVRHAIENETIRNRACTCTYYPV